MSLLTLANEIIKLSEIGNYFGRGDLSVQSFGLGESSINFVNENRYKYYDTINEIFNLDSEIEKTYTLKKYETLFISHFSRFMLSKTQAKQSDIHLFYESLKAEKKDSFQCLGIYME